MCGETQVAPDLAVDRDILVLGGECRHHLDRDDRVERDEHRRQRNAKAIAERDHDERPEKSPRERVREARLRQVEHVEHRRVEREDEDRDLDADQNERDLTPEDTARERSYAPRGSRPRHYRALSKSSFARSKYQKPRTKRTIATPAEYARPSHCGARPSSSARWYATMIEVMGLR